jgi:hypothetical protein
VIWVWFWLFPSFLATIVTKPVITLFPSGNNTEPTVLRHSRTQVLIMIGRTGEGYPRRTGGEVTEKVAFRRFFFFFFFFDLKEKSLKSNNEKYSCLHLIV